MPDPRPGRGRLLLACLALTLTPQGGSPPIRLSARPVLDIGGGTGDSLSEFTQITGLFSLSNGDIAVASFVQPPFIRIFQRNGPVRATAGRTGGGPGEYRAALWIRPMKSDSILVYDPVQARFSVLSGDGRLGRSITIVGPAAGMRTYVFGRFEDGSLISRPNSMIPPEASGHGRAMVPLLRLSETGGLIDTLGHFPDAEYFTEGPAVIARTPQEFRAQPQRSLVPFGLVSVFLSGDRSFFVGTGDSFEITEYDFKGVPVRTFTRPGQRRPVRPDDLAALKAERLSQARRREDSTRIEEEWSKVKPASLMLHMIDQPSAIACIASGSRNSSRPRIPLPPGACSVPMVRSSGPQSFPKDSGPMKSARITFWEPPRTMTTSSTSRSMGSPVRRSLLQRMRPSSADQWVAMGFGLLLFLFLITLILLPSAVGRGGR